MLRECGTVLHTDNASEECWNGAVAVALNRSCRGLERDHATTRADWKRCYHRFRYARHYHDPADPDCSWTWTQVQIAAEILQRLIERRRP